MSRHALLATTGIFTVASTLFIGGIYGVKSQQFTNPVTVMYLTSSTGVPVGVSTANSLPVNIVAGAGSGCVGTTATPCVISQATAANLNMTEVNSAAILTAVQAAIPAGSNNIGLVTLATGTNTIGILATGSNNIGSVVLATGANTIGVLATGSNIIGALSANQTVNTAQIGGSNVVADPCQQVAKSYAPVTIATNSATRIITGTSLKKTYICSLFIISGPANNISLIEGTTACATISAAMIGATAASGGVNMAANGGFTFGNGGAAITVTATTADDVCFISSATGGQYSGVVSYVQL